MLRQVCIIGQDSAVAKEEGSEEDEDSEEEYDRREAGRHNPSAQSSGWDVDRLQGLWPLEKLKARLEARFEP